MKSTQSDSCIYCGTTQNLCRQSHIVSRNLGAFENQPSLHYKVCKTCEGEIGKCEEQIAKSGLEALIRENLGIKGRHKNSISSFERKHSGHGPIKMKAKIPGIDDEFLFKPKGDEKNAEFLNQILLKDSTGKWHQIPVPNISKLNLDNLQQLIKAENIKNPICEAATIGENNEATNHIFSLLKQIFKGDEKTDIIEPFQGIIKYSGRLTYDDRYFRGIVKIAFHYYLAFNNIGHQGHERIFQPVREFIRYGKGRKQDVISEHKGYFVEQLRQGWRPPTYGHILYSEATNKNIIARVQLFVGPEYDPPYYEVVLSRNPFSIKIPRQAFGHNYSYLPHNQRKQYDGTFHELAMSQILI